MKRWIAALLCALMLTTMFALAEGSADPFATYPPGNEADPFATNPPGDETHPFPTSPAGDGAPRGDAASDGSITLTIDGQTIALAFDPSPQYSSIAGGLVQASYYAYGADGFTMYELYMIFPETAKPGMVITPEYAALAGEECSVMLIVSTNDRELYYSASLMNGAVYPEGSGFSIAIDDIRDDGGATAYSGRLRATLVALDVLSGEPVATLTLDETPFRFAIRRDSSFSGPVVPQSTPMPEDMRKV